MGNSNTKRSDDYSSSSSRKKNKEFVDQQINYGSLVTHGIYTAPPEYDIDVVREFILKKKLSPFYKGMEEYSDNPFPGVLASTSNLTIESSKPLSEEPVSINTIENANSSNDEGSSSNSNSKKRLSRKSTQNSGEVRRKNRPESSTSMKLKRYTSLHKSDNSNDNYISSSSTSPTSPSPNNSIKVEPEHPLYSKEEFFKYPIECPICFLYYPRNINYTRCCDQPICTECFIQIKRTFSNPEPTCCPYCVQSNFGVIYFSPDSEEYQKQYEILIKAKEEHDPEYEKLLSQGSTPGKKRRNSISYTDPHIISSDDIYPGWMLKYEQYQREQQRLEAMRVRNFNMQVNNNVAVALLDAFFQIPPENIQTRSSRRGQSLQTLEEVMLLEAIRRSLADSSSQETDETTNNLPIIEENNISNVIENQNEINEINEVNEINEINDEINDNTSNLSLTNAPEETTENILDISTNEDNTIEASNYNSNNVTSTSDIVNNISSTSDNTSNLPQRQEEEEEIVMERKEETEEVMEGGGGEGEEGNEIINNNIDLTENTVNV